MGILLHQKICFALERLIQGHVLFAVGKAFVLHITLEKFFLDLDESLVPELLELALVVFVLRLEILDVEVFDCLFLIFLVQCLLVFILDSLDLIFFLRQAIFGLSKLSKQLLIVRLRVELVLCRVELVTELDNLSLCLGLVMLILRGHV